MEKCFRCENAAAFRCPSCGAVMCAAHLEPRYTGPERGFDSKNMCPVCWKEGKVTLDSHMEKVGGAC